MQLYFVRHAQSENNAMWVQTGSSKGRVMDPALTEMGHRQAERVAEFLARPVRREGINGTDPQNVHGFGITHVYSSLMQRAVATGTAIARALDLPLHALETCHEEGGIYLDDEDTGEPVGHPGPNRSFFEQNFPHLVLPDTIGERGWWDRPFEANETRLARAQQFVQTLLEKHGATEDRVVVVSHGGFYNLFMTVLLGLPNPYAEPNGNRQYWFAINNTAITRVDFRDKETGVLYQNRVDFLPPELIT